MIQRYHAYGTYAGDDGTFVDYADHTAALAAKDAELAEMEARKDAAYLERNQCVALIATMAHALGHWAGIARTAIEGWSEDWHGCVYIDLPAGQVSWHYHDSQAYLFAHLPPYCGEWDGHDTPEKYRRVLQRPVSNARAERAEAALLRKGYRMSCDIPACNCGDQWTHGGHAEMRLTEIREALEQADARRNGETLLADVVHIAARAERATTIEAELAALRADAEIGQRWKRDNSLETWFPYTAEELVRLRAEVELWKERAYQLSHA